MDVKNARRIQGAIRVSQKLFPQRLLQVRLIRTEYLKLLRFVAWKHILTLDIDAYEFP